MEHHQNKPPFSLKPDPNERQPCWPYPSSGRVVENKMLSGVFTYKHATMLDDDEIFEVLVKEGQMIDNKSLGKMDRKK